MRVAIVYRVLQEWRAPVFSRLAKHEKVTDFKVFYGCDFVGTKVVSTKSALDFDAEKMRSIPIRIPSGKGQALTPLSPFLFFSLIRFRPDVVICEGASNFINNIFVFLYCLFFRVPMVQWGLGEIRGTQKSTLRKLLDILIVPIEKRAKAVVSYSSVGKKYYMSLGLPEKSIFVAVNVVDTEKRLAEIAALNSVVTAKNDGLHVIFVGALEVNKKVDVLLKAFSILQHSYPNAQLTIVGDGHARSSLQLFAEELKITNCTFTGKVFDGVSRYFLAADVFVLPGLGGLAVSDALVHGLPVICTIGDGCEVDLIQNNINGVVDDALDEHAIATYLQELAANPLKLAQMKEAAKGSLGRYNIANYVSQVIEAANYAVTKKG